ncbi:ATP-binding protein [Clostridium sp.]|uniref:ATP-binding protein n=1 Tax=Clostridium sp. TaxID=1506 RepID=UPI0032170125
MNRDKEREFLNDEYNRDGSSLVILYGRRRVGKTALTVEFMKGKDALYYLVTEESEAQNRTAFKNMVASYTDNELLSNASVQNWDIIFKSLIDYKSDKKKLIIIDEFQYLGKSNGAFPSIFQKIWDTMLKDKNVMVILCGSLISMMESQTLAYTSPLYGRRTGQIKLKQIPFRYYNEFFQSKNRKELIEYYAVTGGIPKYIELFYDSQDIYTAIEKNVLSKSSFLYDEPNFLLQREVSEVGSYFSIIKAIAAGNEKLGKIAGVLEIKQTGITKYLNTLINLDIIEREVPITEENPEKSKRGLYKIKDNFILFWFKFIYPNLSFIESGNEKIAMTKICRNLIDRHVSYVYEDVCIEEMWQLCSEDRWSFYFDKVGRWWNSNTEIDIVAIDSTGEDIIFGECKYWEGKVGIDVLKALEEKAKSVEWKKGNRKEHFILFSINGFTEDLINLSKERDDLILSQ